MPVEFAERLTNHLTSCAGTAVRVHAIEPLSGGACQENFRIDAVFEAGPHAGARRLVLRSDARSSLLESLDRAREFAVIEAAFAAQVPTPRARWLVRDLVREGAWAYLLDWVDGVAIGRKVLRDTALANARTKLAEQLADALAKIHSVRPTAHSSLLNAGDAASSDFDPVSIALQGTRRLYEKLGDPRPAIDLALVWLHAHRPPRSNIVLVHGDYRVGNFMVGPDGLCAVLDWEFAHWGAPEEDIAWVCLRDWRFGQVHKAVGGFADREDFYGAYERATGTTLSVATVHFWEILRNVQWAVGSLQQTQRYLAGEQDIELLAIGRRAVEMEWEALRLIDRGPRR